MNLSINNFDEFLKLIFPELDEYGRPIGGVDDFQTVRMFAISNVNTLQFG